MERRRPDSRGAQITVSVGGILVSGVIISAALYMQLFLDGAIQDVIDRAKASGALQPEDGIERDPPEFLHLASAKFWLPDHHPIPSGEGVLWRCRIDRIDGYHLGEFGVSHENVA
jgi:hypothetical protein